jgi:malate synthase
MIVALSCARTLKLVISAVSAWRLRAWGGMRRRSDQEPSPRRTSRLARVRADKEREAGDGLTAPGSRTPGSWPVGAEIFGPPDARREQTWGACARKFQVDGADLLRVPDGRVTPGGCFFFYVRSNIDVGQSAYPAAWLGGNGCVPIPSLDGGCRKPPKISAGPALASGWRARDGRSKDGTAITLFKPCVTRQSPVLAEIRRETGDVAFNAGPTMACGETGSTGLNRQPWSSSRFPDTARHMKTSI